MADRSGRRRKRDVQRVHQGTRMSRVSWCDDADVATPALEGRPTQRRQLMDLWAVNLQLPDGNVPPEDTLQNCNLFQALSLLECVFWFVPRKLNNIRLQPNASLRL